MSDEQYRRILYFFRADSCALDGLRACWLGILAGKEKYTVGGLNVLIVDGTNVTGEGKRTVGTQKISNSPQDQSKPKHFFGRRRQFVGALMPQAKRSSVFLRFLSYAQE